MHRIFLLLLRVCAPLALLLGILQWTAWLDLPLALHITFGSLTALALAGVAIPNVGPSATRPLAVAGLVVAVAVPLLGLTQTMLLPDDATHWMIQVLHLALGVGALTLGEVIAQRANRTAPRAATLA